MCAFPWFKKKKKKQEGIPGQKMFCSESTPRGKKITMNVLLSDEKLSEKKLLKKREES